jgi:hypothetical protein
MEVVVEVNETQICLMNFAYLKFNISLIIFQLTTREHFMHLPIKTWLNSTLIN